MKTIQLKAMTTDGSDDVVEATTRDEATLFSIYVGEPGAFEWAADFSDPDVAYLHAVTLQETLRISEDDGCHLDTSQFDAVMARGQGMKTIKVSEATNTQLDWLVAKCEGEEYSPEPTTNGIGMEFSATNYTTDVAQMWPIIENMLSDGFELKQATFSAAFQCIRVRGDTVVAGFGPTLLIAAARCYVVSKLGETAEVPEELT